MGKKTGLESESIAQNARTTRIPHLSYHKKIKRVFVSTGTDA
jgi:hypothetical protein